jgi:signal transduction histidine kinase/CheY-like chemotaxis protein
MKSTKKYMSKLLLPIAITVAMIFMSAIAYKHMLKAEENVCWNTLVTTASTINKEIEARFKDNISMLKLASNAMVQENRVEDYKAISAHLKDFQPMTIFSRIDIIYPNNKILYQNGELKTQPSNIVFKEVVEHGEHMSLRTTDALSGKQIIYYAVPIVKDNKTAAMMLGVIFCDNMPKIFPTEAYEGKAFCTLVDYRDGSFISDAWHKELGNIFAMRSRTALPGYENVNLLADVRQGKTGISRFISKVNGKNSFMYYMPTKNFNWELLMVVQEEIAYKSVFELKNTLFMLGGFIGLLILLYFLWTMYTVNQLEKSELDTRNADEANKAKTEFFSRMSHDMRTPMNGILGLVELSDDETDITVLKNNIGRIKQSSEYLLGLINDTLDFQKIESGKMALEPQIVATRDLVNNVFKMIQLECKKKNITLKMKVENADLDCLVNVDPMRMKQIFFNILSNSVKFTKPGGIIEICFKCVGHTGNIAHDVITITDTGIGMSKDFLEHDLFQPFSQEHSEITTNYAGTGLGLSIAKKLVELMHGDIAIESELGEGTKVIVTIDFERAEGPGIQKKIEQSEMQEAEAKAILAGKKILLAEDQPLNAEIAKRLLEKNGCIVEWVKDGQECCQRFAAAEEGEFALILMDIRMPNMDGLEATRRIRNFSGGDAATIPIIAMTANAYVTDVQNCLDAGMNAHIAKPINPHLMFTTIARFLNIREKTEK